MPVNSCTEERARLGTTAHCMWPCMAMYQPILVVIIMFTLATTGVLCVGVASVLTVPVYSSLTSVDCAIFAN